MAGRVYQRKFDWDEAVRLRRQGLTLKEIGSRLGVSASAVQLATNPRALAMNRNNRALHSRVHGNPSNYRGVCVDCGGKCRTVAKRCRECWLASRRPHVDGSGRVLCTRCESYKPADSFTLGGNSAGRGFRRAWCRDCDTRAREANRDRARAYDRAYQAKRRAGV